MTKEQLVVALHLFYQTMKRSHIDEEGEAYQGNGDDDDDDDDPKKDGSNTNDNDTTNEENVAKRRKSLNRKREREVVRRSFINEAFENLEKTVYELDPSVRSSQPQRRRRNSSRLSMTTIPNQPALLNHAASLIGAMDRNQRRMRQMIERTLEEQRRDTDRDAGGAVAATAQSGESQNQNEQEQPHASVDIPNVPTEATGRLVQDPRLPNQPDAHLPIAGLRSGSTQRLPTVGASFGAANLQNPTNLLLQLQLQSRNQLQNAALLRSAATARTNQTYPLPPNPQLGLAALDSASWIAAFHPAVLPLPPHVASLAIPRQFGYPMLQPSNAAILSAEFVNPVRSSSVQLSGERENTENEEEAAGDVGRTLT